MLFEKGIEKAQNQPQFILFCNIIQGEPKKIGIPTNMKVTSKIFTLEKIN